MLYLCSELYCRWGALYNFSKHELSFTSQGWFWFCDHYYRHIEDILAEPGMLKICSCLGQVWTKKQIIYSILNVLCAFAPCALLLIIQFKKQNHASVYKDGFESLFMHFSFMFLLLSGHPGLQKTAQRTQKSALQLQFRGKWLIAQD